ncbi:MULTISPECIES: hypothetical protein [Desertifilum]|nr:MULTISPECIES: hypothetical protein [Desertifilum]MDA0208627.1 hypothetical protein [Cyanobacteria bacterium FC1]
MSLFSDASIWGWGNPGAIALSFFLPMPTGDRGNYHRDSDRLC